ncbi:MAG: MerR family DNA-binding transcriptional regulator, partial [Chloroflexales bacterium]|nr:MerR family DNA-binding transcriptional regulator [Chloroflexales bacterium]
MNTYYLTIGALARRTGVATSALRFYEERGLIHSERTTSGHRRYPRAVRLCAGFILFAQRLGF